MWIAFFDVVLKPGTAGRLADNDVVCKRPDGKGGHDRFREWQPIEMD